MKVKFYLATAGLIVSQHFIAQTNKMEDVHLTMDCASSDNTVNKATLEKCAKFTLVGTDKEKYEIVSSIVSFNRNKTINEFNCSGNEMSKECKSAFLKSVSGETIYVENTRIKRKSDGIVKTLPTLTLIVK